MIVQGSNRIKWPLKIMLTHITFSFFCNNVLVIEFQFFKLFLGSEFNNAITEELFKLTGIKHKPTSSYHPQGNGIILLYIKTLGLL